MSQQAVGTARVAILVEDAALIRMMGFPVLEPCLPGGPRTSRSTRSSRSTKVG